jgi:stringent starvation protein B
VAQGETPPPKKDVARALLLRGSAYVYLDPRQSGVRVPPWFAQQPQLVLQVGLDLPVPIPDLRVDDHGVFGTLSFNRAPFTCTVPWSAVFALVGDDGMGMVWPDDMPQEIAAEVEHAAQREKKQPRLRSIDGGGAEAEPPSVTRSGEGPAVAPPLDAPADAEEEGRRRLPPYLRVIK